MGRRFGVTQTSMGSDHKRLNTGAGSNPASLHNLI